MKPKTGTKEILAKAITTLLTAGLLVLGFMFSVIALAVVALLGSIVLVYFWWKTRALRKALRQQVTSTRTAFSPVIEGEATVVRERGSGRSCSDIETDHKLVEFR